MITCLSSDFKVRSLQISPFYAKTWRNKTTPIKKEELKLETTTVSLNNIQTTTEQVLVAHGTKRWIAQSVAHAVRKAEEYRNLICGLYYLESYCTQLKTGRVDGTAEPEVTLPKPSSIKVNAKLGFAQPA